MKKDFLHKRYHNICSYFYTNRLFISYVIITFLCCLLVKAFTSGGTFQIRSMVMDLAIILAIGSFCYLKQPNKRFGYLLFWLCFVAFLGTVHTIYYRFYASFGSIGDLATLPQAETVTGSIFERIGLDNIVFFLMPVIFYYINRKLKTTSYFNYISIINNGKKYFLVTLIVGLSLFGIRFACATTADYNSLKKLWNRSHVVQRFGMIFYQAHDVVQALKPHLNSIFGYDEAYKLVKDFYDNKDTSYIHNNKYTGIIEGKNIIFVHMESIQNFLMDLSFNGKEVTPHLNKLSKEGMFFSNFYPEVSTGTSSDTEFTLSTSLMPVASGTVFVTYYNRDFVSMQKILADKGYNTFSMHGNYSSMWNRNKAHPSLGYQDMYFRESYTFTDEDVINLGINDKLFFEQSIPILEQIEQDNEKYMGTIITLSNHSPFNFVDKYGDFDLTKTFVVTNHETGRNETITVDYLEGKSLGNYIKSVHYADEALGEFLNYIKKSDYFNDTIFVFYGDHDARFSQSELNYLYNYNPLTKGLYDKDDPEYQSYDYFDHELNKKTPLIIWTKNSKLKNTFKGNIKYYMGMIDVQPTILNMFGLSNPYALGHDIFNIKNDNVIPFPNGNFLTSEMYYNNSTGEFKLINDNSVIGVDYVEERVKDTEQILNISNMVIIYNLLAKLNEQ